MLAAMAIVRITNTATFQSIPTLSPWVVNLDLASAESGGNHQTNRESGGKSPSGD